jgi:hypothetical protein
LWRRARPRSHPTAGIRRLRCIVQHHCMAGAIKQIGYAGADIP